MTTEGKSRTRDIVVICVLDPSRVVEWCLVLRLVEAVSLCLFSLSLSLFVRACFSHCLKDESTLQKVPVVHVFRSSHSRDRGCQPRFVLWMVVGEETIDDLVCLF